MTGATRRLFFALWPDPNTRQAIVRQSRRAVRGSGGRPVPSRNYHVTLAFLGSVSEVAIPEISAAARQLRTPAGEMALEEFGYWPRPRVLWVGPSATPRSLAQLVSQLWDTLEAVPGLGLAREPRPWQPHLTLARKVNREPALTSPKPVIWPMNGFVLCESVTAEDGARYQVLEQFGRD